MGERGGQRLGQDGGTTVFEGKRTHNINLHPADSQVQILPIRATGYLMPVEVYVECVNVQRFAQLPIRASTTFAPAASL